MKRPAERLLDLLNFYGSTFGRLCTDDFEELGQTVAALASAVLGCRTALVFFKPRRDGLRLVGEKGLGQARLREWPADSLFARALWETVEHAAFVRGSDLGPALQADALAQRLGDAWLVVPIRDASARDEERIGLIVASDLRQPIARELALTVLDILASFTSGALRNFTTRAQLAAVNRDLLEEVAERDRAEQEVRRLNQDLEIKVAERTSELVEANRELALRAASAIENARLYAREQRARDMADAASRAKDDFLATVSHELRTPLSAILGWTKLLATTTVDERRRARAIETIERNALGMARLIDDLLDVSRIVSGKIRLDLTTVHLAPIIENTIESALPAASARSVQIEQRLDVDAGPVQGDAERLRQVVRNLLGNAVKFTPAGGRVTVSLARRGAQAELAVKDTGRGIEAHFLPHVFEPFRQETSSVARGSAGLGLGLAIVKELVELHGGNVDAASDGPDRGSTFTVRLPVRAPRARSKPGQRGSGAARTPALATLPQLEGLRVLVVEDEADMRDLLSHILTSCRSLVTTAESVAEAMGFFTRGEVPDVLLSDISMPVETGYDLIRRVRALPVDSGGKVPAAALTALARAGDRRSVLNAGFDLHVPKPVEPAEVVTAVATLARLAGR